MRKTRLSVGLTLAAIAVTMLPVRRDENADDDAIEPIASILETVGEGEAFAGKKGTWKCHAACIVNFSPGHPRYKAPGCPQNLQQIHKKDFARCDVKGGQSEAKSLMRDECESKCSAVNDQCYCKHEHCRFVD